METIATDFEDIRQTEEWGKYLAGAGWVVERIRGVNGNELNVVLKKLPIWPVTVLKLQRNAVEPNWDDLKKIRRKHRTVYSIIEPLRDSDGYKKNRYGLSFSPYLPSKTLVLDLTKSEKQLWSGLSENARRQTKKNQIEVEEVTANEWRILWKKWSKIWILNDEEMKSMEKAFGKSVKFYIGKINGQVQSGLLVVYSRTVANYYQTWTSEMGKKTGAHYSLVWEAILRAKNLGKKYFDFEGIYDERFPQKRWRGFSEFKRRFGGKIVEFVGCYSRWL